MTRTTATRSGMAFALAALSACGTTPGQHGMTVRDSAGVLIVEHEPEPPRGVEHWSLDTEPTLVVGTVEGDDPYLFTRIIHAGLLPGGELLVADAVARELRAFDAAGRFVRRFGRQGEGPGEFQALQWVGLDRSGTISAYDGSLRRLSRFDAGDGFREQITIPPSSIVAPVGSALGQFGDGALLLRGIVSLPEDMSRASTGLVRDTIGLFLVAPDGSSNTLIARFPDAERIRAIGRVVAMNPAPFGLRTVVAAADTVFYLSTQERYEIRTWHQDGRLRRVLRRLALPRPIDADARSRWLREADERLADTRGRPLPPPVLEVAEYRTLPEFFPAHGELRVDRVGNLWVEEYRPFPDDDTLTIWTVFGPDGAVRATAELPRVQITEIGADHVVGVWRDDDQVPYVRVYRLVKRPQQREK